MGVELNAPRGLRPGGAGAAGGRWGKPNQGECVSSRGETGQNGDNGGDAGCGGKGGVSSNLAGRFSGAPENFLRVWALFLLLS